MTILMRISVCAVAIVLAGVGLDLVYPSGLLNFGKDLCSLAELRAALRQELERGDRLQERVLVTLERIEAKHRIVSELVNKRISLLKAATEFHELALTMPQAERKYQRFDFQNGEDTNWLCRQTIAYVKLQLSSEPDLAVTVASRLEHELHEMQPNSMNQPF